MGTLLLGRALPLVGVLGAHAVAAVTGAVGLAVVGSCVGAADAGRDDVVGFPGVVGAVTFMAEAADAFLDQGLGSS